MTTYQMSQQKNPNIKITKNELKNIMEEYEPDAMTDNEDIYKYKEAIKSLDKSDQIIFALYSELQSERKVAELLGVSRSPVHKIITSIREKILKHINDTNKHIDNTTTDSICN